MHVKKGDTVVVIAGKDKGKVGKVLNAMPDGQGVKAGRILEINPNHDIFKAIQNVYQNNADKINDYASLLFDQALLIEGLSIEDPVAFSNKICELMIELNK